MAHQLARRAGVDEHAERTSSVTGLTVTCWQLATYTVLRVSGEVDATTSAHLEAELSRALRLGKPIVVELSGMTFLDSGGLAVLLRAHQGAEQRGHELRLTALDARPARLLELTGMMAYLHVHPTIQDAVTALTATDQRLAAEA
ncbi:STAS domain-containing protein [Streptosporangium sandarakinum]|uniref:STAS domain-containing protein n=1 Tax=Streptosporangium sandarakinum TaxID=1260955 RepID=UPI003716F781